MIRGQLKYFLNKIISTEYTARNAQAHTNVKLSVRCNKFYFCICSDLVLRWWLINSSDALRVFITVGLLDWGVGSGSELVITKQNSPILTIINESSLLSLKIYAFPQIKVVATPTKFNPGRVTRSVYLLFSSEIIFLN